MEPSAYDGRLGVVCLCIWVFVTQKHCSDATLSTNCFSVLQMLYVPGSEVVLERESRHSGALLRLPSLQEWLKYKQNDNGDGSHQGPLWRDPDCQQDPVREASLANGPWTEACNVSCTSQR